MKKTIPSHPLILSILDGFTPVVVHNSSTPHKQPNGSWFPMDIDIDIMKNHPIPSFYPFAKLHGCQQRSKGCRAAQDLTKERHITRHRVTRRHASPSQKTSGTSQFQTPCSGWNSLEFYGFLIGISEKKNQSRGGLANKTCFWTMDFFHRNVNEFTWLFVSWDDDIPNIWKQKYMFQTSNQQLYDYYWLYVIMIV